MVVLPGESNKETIVRNAPAANDEARGKLVAEADRYAREKTDIEKAARDLDAEAKSLDAQSERAISPHHRLAQVAGAGAGGHRAGRAHGTDPSALDAGAVRSQRCSWNHVLGDRLDFRIIIPTSRADVQIALN